jgi:hypothetical protein
MALRTWIGGDSSVAQIDTATFGGTWENNDVVTFTLTDESGAAASVSSATGSTVVGTITAAFFALLNASTDPRFRVVTWTNPTTTTIVGTADTAGIPFHLTVTTTENGGGAADAQTLTNATTTPNQGPYDYSDASNWSEHTVPVAGDEVVIDGAYGIIYGLQQSGVTLDAFTVLPTYTGTIGYEGAPLFIDLTDATGVLQLDGLGTYHLNVNDSAIPVRVSSTSAPQNGSYNTLTVDRASYPVVTLLGSGMTTLTATGGRIDIARQFGTTSTVATIQNSGATITAGSGVSLTTYSQSAGSGMIRCNTPNVNVDGGCLTTEGTGTITTYIQNGGRTTSNSTGTITSATVNRGVLDFSQSRASRTVTNLYGGGKPNSTILIIQGTVTVTNPYGTASTPEG